MSIVNEKKLSCFLKTTGTNYAYRLLYLSNYKLIKLPAIEQTFSGMNNHLYAKSVDGNNFISEEDSYKLFTYFHCPFQSLIDETIQLSGTGRTCD